MTAPCPTLGFLVSMDADVTSEEWAGLAEAWAAFLEARGLYARGRLDLHRLEYAVLSEAWQATEGDRVAVEEWLASRDDLMSWRVGGLEDFERLDAGIGRHVPQPPEAKS